MGTVWALLLGLGMVAPALVLAASAWLVHRLATSLRRLQPASRPACQWVVGHVALVFAAEGGAAGLLGLFGPRITVVLPTSLAVLSMAVAPFYLYRRIRTERSRHPEVESEKPGSEGPGPVFPSRAPDRRWRTALLFVSTGVFLPWLVALGVKIYLDSQGRPTLPVSDFTDPQALPVLLVLTLTLWAFPFLVLASAVTVPWRVGFSSDPTGRESMLPIWLAYAGGVLGDLLLFIGIFWEFDAIMLIVPLGMYLLPPMIVGYVIGWWAVRRRSRRAGHGGSPGGAAGRGMGLGTRST